MKGSTGTAQTVERIVSYSPRAIRLRQKKLLKETASATAGGWINPHKYVSDRDKEILHRKLIKAAIINHQQRGDDRKDGMEEWHTMFDGDNKRIKVVAMSRKKANILNKFNRENGIAYRYSLGGA